VNANSEGDQIKKPAHKAKTTIEPAMAPKVSNLSLIKLHYRTKTKPSNIKPLISFALLFICFLALLNTPFTILFKVIDLMKPYSFF